MASKKALMVERKNGEIFSPIRVNPKVRVGKPTIRGLRITVEQILQALAGGVTAEELRKEYPKLEREDIHAVLLYAAELANEERIYAVNAG